MNKKETLKLRCEEMELFAWKKAAEEVGISLSEWIRAWLNHGIERNKRGELVHK